MNYAMRPDCSDQHEKSSNLDLVNNKNTRWDHFRQSQKFSATRKQRYFFTLKGLPPRRDSGTLSFLIFGPDFPFFIKISSFWFNHNVFQTQYFSLEISGSLKQFLKRSFPVYLVQKHPENLNISENSTVSKIDDTKFYLVHPQIFFSQKDPGFVRFRSILNDPQNLSKKY